ncbi:MAG: sigma-70 family RNA polymerase sigma factor, partial [Planctomycetales bacterium]|nr:sigma-70 family RNA polymerase sigma factor [Planctomycetales bacterium]
MSQHIISEPRASAATWGVEPASNDAALIRRFASSNDQAAFAALVRRHGPLVMGVCRRLLRDHQHAEDAFQATFLVLAKKSGTVRWRRSIASWLHRVAYGVCLNARRRLARRRELETPLDAPLLDVLTRSTPSPAGPLEALTQREEMFVFDEELAALPERFRGPLVLFYLDGMSRGEVAHALGLSDAAVKSRLERGRRRLRVRLLLRGVALSSAVVLLQQTQPAAAAAVGESLIAATTGASASLASGGATGTPPPEEVVSLAEGQLRMMTWTTFTTKGALAATGLTSAVLLTCALGSGMAFSDDAASAPPAAVKATADDPPDPFGGPVVVTAKAPAKEVATKPATEVAVPAESSITASRIIIRRSSEENTGKDVGGPAGQYTPSMSEQEEKIVDTLDAQTSFDFVEEELGRVAEYLSDLHQIPVVLDAPALEDFGVGTDAAVNGGFEGVRLSSALQMLLKPLHLTTTVADDVLLITTPDELPNYARIRTYHVPELVDADWTADELVEMLCTMFDDIDEETVVGHGTTLVVRATVE